MDGVIFPSISDVGFPITSRSDLQTKALGAKLGSVLTANSILCFFGDLGAGKTTFIKGLVAALTDVPMEQVNSPTYTYLNIYEGKIPVYHFDLYRLRGEDDFLQMGFDEYFTAGGICCIEWPIRILSILPEEALHFYLTTLSEGKRKIDLQYNRRRIQ